MAQFNKKAIMILLTQMSSLSRINGGLRHIYMSMLNDLDSSMTLPDLVKQWSKAKHLHYEIGLMVAYTQALIDHETYYPRYPGTRKISKVLTSVSSALDNCLHPNLGGSLLPSMPKYPMYMLSDCIEIARVLENSDTPEFIYTVSEESSAIWYPGLDIASQADNFDPHSVILTLRTGFITLISESEAINVIRYWHDQNVKIDATMSELSK